MRPVLKPLDCPNVLVVLLLNILPNAGVDAAPKALLPPPKGAVGVLPKGCEPNAGVDCGLPNAELLAPNVGCCKDQEDVRTD